MRMKLEKKLENIQSKSRYHSKTERKIASAAFRLGSSEGAKIIASYKKTPSHTKSFTKTLGNMKITVSIRKK